MPLTQITNGIFQDNEGHPLSQGWLVARYLTISTYAVSPYAQITAGIRTKIFLDNNGNVAGTQYLWANSNLSPASSYYTVEAYNNKGLKVWASPQYWIISATSPVDLGTLTSTNP